MPKNEAYDLCEYNLKNICFAKCETFLSLPSIRSTSLSSRLELSERDDLREDSADWEKSEEESESSNLSSGFNLCFFSFEKRAFSPLSVSMCCVGCGVVSSSGKVFFSSGWWDFCSSASLGFFSSDGCWEFFSPVGWDFFSTFCSDFFFFMCWDFFSSLSSSWCVVCKVCML